MDHDVLMDGRPALLLKQSTWPNNVNIHIIVLEIK